MIHKPTPMHERSGSNGGGEYRYGFQNQEEDKEFWEGAVSFKYRVEDARLGRFFSVDPLRTKYPWNSNYAFSENRVSDGVELEGLEYDNSTGRGGAVGPLRPAVAEEEGSFISPYYQTLSISEPSNINSPSPNLKPIIPTKSDDSAQSSENKDDHGEKTESTKENSSGLGFYTWQYTANLSANAGGSYKIGPGGGTFNFGEQMSQVLMTMIFTLQDIIFLKILIGR